MTRLSHSVILRRDLSGKDGNDMVNWLEENCSDHFYMPSATIVKGKAVFQAPILVYFVNEEDKDEFLFWYSLRF